MSKGGVKVKIQERDRGWKAIYSEVQLMKKATVGVGVFADKGGGARADGMTNVQLATIHEFGAPKAGIPERSFLRSTLHEKRQEVTGVIEKLIKEILTRRMKVQQALGILGSVVATEIKNRVTKGESIPPPLSPRTIARKGSSRALVDTGRMIGAITWKVFMDGKR